MSMDQRDYYVDKLREQQGYTETARFRASLGRPRWIKPTSGMSAGRAIVVALSAVFLVLWVAAKLLRG
jgi:hypothetical protein